MKNKILAFFLAIPFILLLGCGQPVSDNSLVFTDNSQSEGYGSKTKVYVNGRLYLADGKVEYSENHASFEYGGKKVYISGDFVIIEK